MTFEVKLRLMCKTIVSVMPVKLLFNSYNSINKQRIQKIQVLWGKIQISIFPVNFQNIKSNVHIRIDLSFKYLFFKQSKYLENTYKLPIFSKICFVILKLAFLFGFLRILNGKGYLTFYIFFRIDSKLE